MTCFSPGVLLLRLAFVALCLFHLLLCPHHSTAASTHRLLDTQGSQSYDERHQPHSQLPSLHVSSMQHCKTCMGDIFGYVRGVRACVHA